MALDNRTPSFGLSVLRNSMWSADATLGGVTSTHDQLALVGYIQLRDEDVSPLRDGVPGRIDPDQAPPVVLQANHVYGEITVALVPLIYVESTGVWRYEPGRFMAGGNYAATSDSRVSRLVSWMIGHRFYGALAVHDRDEN